MIMAETKRFIVACSCMATYIGTIQVPADHTLEQAIAYAREHLKEVTIDCELDHIGDSDELVEGYCKFSEEDEG